MAIDLASESARGDFRKALKLSERVREEFSTRRAGLIAKCLGDNWSLSSKKETITSLLYRAYETFSFDLIISRPRCQITSRDQQNAGFARNFSLAVNNYAKKINFGDELMAGIMDAMFGMAVFKRHWAPSNERLSVVNPDIDEPGMESGPDEWMKYREQQHIEVDPGEPMIERLCPEDWIYDTSQGRRRDFRYEVHRYRRPLADVREDKRFNKDVRQALKGATRFDSESRTRAERLSQQGYHHDGDDDLEPMVTLRDVWLPKEKKFVVLSDDATLAPLLIGPWKGPPRGPFTPLIFSALPDNFEPISMLGNLEIQHDTLNSLLRKMIGQARRQKSVTAYVGPENDAIRLGEAKDGDRVRIMSPEAIQILKSDGVNPSVGQFATVIQQLGSKEAGNLELIAGTAQMSDTASQDEMLNARSSAMQSKRMQRVAAVAGELYEALGWMLWHDVAQTVPGSLDIPEYGVKVDATWQPDERYGEIEDYEFSYTPYNEQYQSPQQKMQLINGLITNFYVPLLPVLQQSGQTLDLSEIAQFHADMANAPEILRFIKPMPAPQPGMMGPGGAPPEDGGELPAAPSMPGDKVYTHLNQTNNPVGQRPENAWADMATMEQ
jgi:hypothetical protein